MRSNPIKTLHLTNAFHQTSGGISTSLRAMMAEAERQSREMRLIVPGTRDEIEDAGRHTRIYYVRSPRSPLFDSRYRLLLPHQYILDGGKVREILISEQPDLIEVSDKYTLNWLAGIIRKRGIRGLRRPVLVGMSCERMDDNVAAFLSNGAIARRLSRFYTRWLYMPMFDFHIANSSYTAEELLRDARADAIDRILICPRGVDWDHFSCRQRSALARRHLLQEVDGGPETRLLLYAGRLSPEKNVPLLVDTMEILAHSDRDYRLLVAGGGPLENWIKREGKTRARGKICMLSHITDREELAYLYTNSDAFVHPNPREPFGIAPLEAMAAGCPVVVPCAGGVLSYADETNSWIAQPRGEAFAAAVEDVFTDPRVRKEKCDRAREKAAEHRWPAVVSKYFEVYDELHRRFHEEESSGRSFAWTKGSERVESRESRVESQGTEESLIIRRR